MDFGRAFSTRVQSNKRRFWPWLAVLAGALAACEGATSSEPPSVVVQTGGAPSAGAGTGGGDGGTSVGPGGEGGGLGLPDPSALPCNSWVPLCDRRYDETSFPVAHAAMANSKSFWDYPAQLRSLGTQLDDSIRGLMLEVHPGEGAPLLCFHDCTEGKAPLIAELGHVRGFLEDNPREVVTLLVENRVPGAEVATAVEAAGLESYLYKETAEPWPTLGEMIERGTRLVVFLTDAQGTPAGFRPLGENVRATSDERQSARELDCELTDGSTDAPMILVHQTLVTEGSPVAGSGGEGGAAPDATPGRPDQALADTVNQEPFLSERLALCTSSLGRKPTFVAVDFYDTSDVIAATQRLDGLIP